MIEIIKNRDYQLNKAKNRLSNKHYKKNYNQLKEIEKLHIKVLLGSMGRNMGRN